MVVLLSHAFKSYAQLPEQLLVMRSRVVRCCRDDCWTCVSAKKQKTAANIA